jgi:3-methyladenine DNA glycosylase AlkD
MYNRPIPYLENECHMSLREIKQQLRSLADPEKAQILQRFFKTGPGQYGEGDRFLGVKVPELRGVAKSHVVLAPDKVVKLLKSAIHEERMTALLIWTYQFDRADAAGRRAIFELYMAHTDWINNWDLVDVTAPQIVGAYLMDGDRSPLYTLAGSQDLWERRIAMVATLTFIRSNQFDDTLAIAGRLLKDDHDLIHKATGWMLREVGKRDQKAMEGFLLKHYHMMPRTMLRYAIEKLPEKRRQDYLKGRAK